MIRGNGKAILAGEHAVVYGKMALATSISLGVSVSIIQEKGAEKNLLISKAIEVAGGEESLEIDIKSDLPIGSGLGSSAAVSAAVIQAVRTDLGKLITQEELFDLVMECEQLAHGNPSGIDASVVVYGGLIGFTKGKPIERLILNQPLKLLLVDSGKPAETTKEMVELAALNPEKDVIFNEIGALVEKVKIKLQKNESIADLLNHNGLLLEQLGVIGDRAKKLSNELRSLGCSVKITGAGGVKTGSGMMIVMYHDLPQIKKFLDNKQIDYFETEIGVQ